MAFLKFSAILCTFLVLSFQTEAVPVQDGVIDELQKILLYITDYLTKVFTRLETIIKNVNANGLDDLQNKTVEVATNLIEFFEASLKGRIANSTKVPSQEGAILIKCVDASINDVTTLIVSYWDVMTKCANPDIKKVIAAVSPILEDLKGVLAKVSVSAAKLNACNNDSTCVISVIAEIYNEVKDIGSVINPDVDVLISTAQATWQAIRNCSDTSAKQWTVNAIGLIDTVAKCTRA